MHSKYTKCQAELNIHSKIEFYGMAKPFKEYIPPFHMNILEMILMFTKTTAAAGPTKA